MGREEVTLVLCLHCCGCSSLTHATSEGRSPQVSPRQTLRVLGNCPPSSCSCPRGIFLNNKELHTPSWAVRASCHPCCAQRPLPWGTWTGTAGLSRMPGPMCACVCSQCGCLPAHMCAHVHVCGCIYVHACADVFLACSLSLATLDDTGLASCSPVWPSEGKGRQWKRGRRGPPTAPLPQPVFPSNRPATRAILGTVSFH